jgi:hypothetical protein
MANENYQFDDILRALSTSAVGIMLALVFNFVTIALDHFLLRPVLNGMRLHLQGDALEASIREHLGRLENTLVGTLTSFNSGVTQVTAALDAWNSTSQQILASQARTSAEIAATHKGFVDTHQALLELPGAVGRQLSAVFSDASASMAATLKRIKAALEAFEKLPEKVEQGIDNSFQQRQAAIEQALSRYRESIESQRTSLDELYAKLRALPVDVAESLGQSSARLVALMEESHKSFLESLKTAVRTTVEDQSARLGALAGQMDLNAGTLRERWDAALVAEQQSFEGAVTSALNASIQAVEQHRARLLALESTLPESLATTFHQLIGETQAATQSLNEAVRQQQASMSQIRGGIAELAVQLRPRGDGGNLRPASPPVPPFRDTPLEVPLRRPVAATAGGQEPVRERPADSDQLSRSPVVGPPSPNPPPIKIPPASVPNTVDGRGFDGATKVLSAGRLRRFWEKIRPSRETPPL